MFERERRGAEKEKGREGKGERRGHGEKGGRREGKREGKRDGKKDMGRRRKWGGKKDGETGNK